LVGVTVKRDQARILGIFANMSPSQSIGIICGSNSSKCGYCKGIRAVDVLNVDESNKGDNNNGEKKEGSEDESSNDNNSSHTTLNSSTLSNSSSSSYGVIFNELRVIEYQQLIDKGWR